MYKYDKNNGLLKNNGYKNFKEYLIKNLDNFKPEIKQEFIKLINFYKKNKYYLNKNRFEFIKLLNKADINVDIKKYLLEIIEENTN